MQLPRRVLRAVVRPHLLAIASGTNEPSSSFASSYACRLCNRQQCWSRQPGTGDRTRNGDARDRARACWQRVAENIFASCSCCLRAGLKGADRTALRWISAHFCNDSPFRRNRGRGEIHRERKHQNAHATPVIEQPTTRSYQAQRRLNMVFTVITKFQGTLVRVHCRRVRPGRRNGVLCSLSSLLQRGSICRGTKVHNRFDASKQVLVEEIEQTLPLVIILGAQGDSGCRTEQKRFARCRRSSTATARLLTHCGHVPVNQL